MDASASQRGAAKKPPAFQFYAKDFLAGTMEMSLIEIGAYAKLLAWSWDNGPVPESDVRRAAILGLSVRSMRPVWDGIADKWTLTSNGYVNQRLEHQRNELSDFKRRQSDRGARGADSRWRKHGASIGASMPEAMPTDKPDDGSAICDLQTAEDLPQRKERAEDARVREGSGIRWTQREHKGGLINGAAMRRHGQHAWCSHPREGFCVPWFLHEEFTGKRVGLNVDADLRAWYERVVAEYEGTSVGDDSIRFWRNKFAAWTGVVTSAPSGRQDKAERTMSSLEQVITGQVATQGALRGE